jgi:hypothetical protein
VYHTINVTICKTIRESFNDMERQKVFSKASEKISMVFYCTIKERMGIIWLNEGIWELRGIRTCCERGRWPLCLGDHDAKHIFS